MDGNNCNQNKRISFISINKLLINNEHIKALQKFMHNYFIFSIDIYFFPFEIVKI